MQIHALLAAGLLFALSAAQAQHRHMHGEGRLDVAIDGGSLTLALELPLDAALGFERAPKNAKEQAALAAVGKTLQDAAALWLPTPAAGCSVQSAQVDMPKFDGGEHADIEAAYVFRCANPAALKTLETTLFRSFSRLYRLETRRAGTAGQGAQRLTPNKPLLAW